MQSRKISILFSRPAEKAGADDQDTLEQVETVRNALEEIGYETRELEADANLPGFRETLEKHRGNLVFNLYDPPEGQGRFISLFPLVLEQELFPYTGCGADALYLTSHKIISKKMMVQRGIPTPVWHEAGDDRSDSFRPGRYIIKSVWEHGSAGLTPDSLVSVSREEELVELLAESGAGVFAERFLPGREINIAFLSDGKGSWEVLPPSEILYSGRNDPSPFLDYRAKWEEDSESYRNSMRSLNFDSSDDPMLKELIAIARECAALFSLNGYARVDFRMDEAGEPHVLEVNANPCLSPGAGFTAAAREAGISYHEMIERIVASPGGKIWMS
ncbi:MAG: ATP-grasp domain-containing protein [Spirochaetota bacterium]|nr:ATP-grasp domain-containing protein [Spirochaetota bacterium]